MIVLIVPTLIIGAYLLSLWIRKPKSSLNGHIIHDVVVSQSLDKNATITTLMSHKDTDGYGYIVFYTSDGKQFICVMNVVSGNLVIEIKRYYSYTCVMGVAVDVKVSRLLDNVQRLERFFGPYVEGENDTIIFVNCIIRNICGDSSHLYLRR